MTKQVKPGKPKFQSKALKLTVLVVIAFLIPVLLYGLRYTEPAPAEPSASSSVTFVEPGNGQPMLIDLGSNNCIPCREMQPVLDELKEEYAGRIVVQVVDVYERRDLAERYGIYAIPTQIFFDRQGKELYRHEGFYPKEEIVAKFRELGML